MTVQPDLSKVKPGMIFATHINGFVGEAIGLLEELDDFDDLELNKYSHVGIYLGNGKTVEAEAGKQGAIIGNISTYMDGRPLLFSTKLNVDDVTLAKVVTIAKSLVGTRYSFVDYLAIAVKRLHLPIPFVKNYVSSSKRMICSQLVAYVYMKAGHPLFGTEWTGDVTPKDIARVIS